jgi:hypothetical protein
MKLVSVALFFEDTAISFIDIEFPEFRTFYLMHLQGLMLWIMPVLIHSLFLIFLGKATRPLADIVTVIVGVPRAQLTLLDLTLLKK